MLSSHPTAAPGGHLNGHPPLRAHIRRNTRGPSPPVSVAPKDTHPAKLPTPGGHSIHSESSTCAVQPQHARRSHRACKPNMPPYDQRACGRIQPAHPETLVSPAGWTPLTPRNHKTSTKASTFDHKPRHADLFTSQLRCRLIDCLRAWRNGRRAVFRWQ